MATTFHPVIRTTQVRQNGTVNIKICVTHNRKAGYLATKYYITTEEFDSKNGKVIPLDKTTEAKDTAGSINLKILAQIGAYATRINQSKEKVDSYTLPMLIKFLNDETDPTDFMSLIEKKIKEKKAIGNLQYAESFDGTKNCLERMGYKSLPLEAITTPWLKALGDQMAILGHSPNTIGNRMRNIRTVFNEADTGRFPFRGYKIPKAITTEHRDLTIEQTALIAKMEIKEPLTRWARDMYMLSFYLIGMNWRDLAFVKEVSDGRIVYTRSKGKKHYSIKVFPEAQAIIDRYQGKKYLLNLMDNYSDYRSGTKRIDKKLKDIAKRCEIDRPVSLYYARHSWGTLASMLEIPEDIISRSMGHAMLKPINEITQIYIRKELKPCDEANEKVIKAILRNDDDDVIISLNL
jgi:integrase